MFRVSEKMDHRSCCGAYIIAASAFNTDKESFFFSHLKNTFCTIHGECSGDKVYRAYLYAETAVYALSVSA